MGSQGRPRGFSEDPYEDDIYSDKSLRQQDSSRDSSSESASGIPQDSAQADIVDQAAGQTVSQADEQANEQAEDDGRDGTISLGLGYGNKGTLLKASFIKRRLFDTDMSMRLSAMHDRYESNIDLGISKPNFIWQGARLDANLFYDAFDNHRSRTIAPYNRKSYGLQATLNFPIDQNNSVYGGLRYTHNRLKDISPEYHRALYIHAADFNDWNFKANDFDLLLGWKYNDLNKKFLPTRGVAFRLDGNISLPGSDNEYYKVKAESEAYFPLNQKETWVLATKASLGYAKGMGGHKVPFYQNFTAGGLGSLRGFAYGAVGPRAVYSSNPMQDLTISREAYTRKSSHVIGGNALAAATVELIMPSFYLSEKYRSNFRTALFVDAASVWETNSKHVHYLSDVNAHSKNVRVSAGLSLQWQFPSGVLSLSYAVPVKKYPGDRLEQFQLNISGSF